MALEKAKSKGYHPHYDIARLEEKNGQWQYEGRKIALPDKIEEILRENHNHKLELLPQTRIHPVFNNNVFKRAATNLFPGQQLQNKPPLDIIKSQEEYKVEAIPDKKVKRNGIQYRVMWKGYEETT